jgi:hypothetical protein
VLFSHPAKAASGTPTLLLLRPASVSNTILYSARAFLNQHQFHNAAPAAHCNDARLCCCMDGLQWYPVGTQSTNSLTLLHGATTLQIHGQTNTSCLLHHAVVQDACQSLIRVGTEDNYKCVQGMLHRHQLQSAVTTEHATGCMWIDTACSQTCDGIGTMLTFLLQPMQSLSDHNQIIKPHNWQLATSN